MLTNGKCELIEAGIDWITCTMASTSPVYRAWRGYCQEFVAMTEGEGAKVDTNGLNGFSGSGTEHAFFGEKIGWSMMVVRGGVAHDFYEELKETQYEPRFTRVDYQVTADYGTFDPFKAADYLREVEKTLGDQRGARRRPVALYEDRHGGTGITIGARDSESYIRIYRPLSKRGSGYNEGAWRFEVECKGGKSQRAEPLMRKAENPAYFAASAVMSELLMVGVQEPWFDSQSFVRLPGTYKPKNEERTMMWFENTVGPAVQKMLESPNMNSRMTRWLIEQERKTR